jgi:hypothetical protein
MATLKGLLEEANRGDGSTLIVTGPHTRWLELPEAEQVYSEEAIQFITDVLKRKYKHPRVGRFSPSSMGECARRNVFSYAGAPEIPPDIDNQEMMDHGSWGHLKWQAEGLTVGYMTAGEVWMHDPELRTGGSMDAKLADGSGFELKTAGGFVYTKVVQVDRQPKIENKMQVSNYQLLGDIDWFSIVYEDRSSGSFHEYRQPRDARIEREVIRRLKSYGGYVDEDELPPMLDLCEQRKGVTYKRCGFRKICAAATRPSQFGNLS